MDSSSTASFICEIPLKATDCQTKEILSRLDRSRMIYNACLGEALKRLNKMRNSYDWNKARQLPKGDKTRNAAFRACIKRYEFQEYSLHSYAIQFGSAWVGQDIGSMVIQKIATRAFQSVEMYQKGVRGKPRFKGKGSFDSVEGKNNQANIVWRNSGTQWSGIYLPAIIDEKDVVIKHALSCRVKYVRIVRRKYNGVIHFSAQLVLEGFPYQKAKNKIGHEVVGQDIGPSTIAVVSGEKAKLLRFCDELEDYQDEIRKLQRKMDRQRRANNQDNYNPDGTVIKGPKYWVKSARYIETLELVAEIKRKQADYRKSLHGRLANEVLALGNIIKTENLSYKAFQKMFGKSVGMRAPGMYMNLLRRKAVNAGGRVEEFNTWTTRLSQTCICGKILKKPLKQRVHHCECEADGIQRDIFSAYLAQFVNENKLDAGEALKAFSGVDTRLRMASSNTQSATNQVFIPVHPARGLSRSSVKSIVRIARPALVQHSDHAGELFCALEPAEFIRAE